VLQAVNFTGYRLIRRTLQHLCFLCCDDDDVDADDDDDNIITLVLFSSF